MENFIVTSYSWIAFFSALYPHLLRRSNWQIAMQRSVMYHMYCKASWLDCAADFK